MYRSDAMHSVTDRQTDTQITLLIYYDNSGSLCVQYVYGRLKAQSAKRAGWNKRCMRPTHWCIPDWL